MSTLPGQRDFAVGQIDAPRRRPLGKEPLGVAAQRCARPGNRFVGDVGIATQSHMHRKTVARELQRRLEHVGQRPGAEIPQRSHQRVEGRGNAGGEQSGAGDQLDSQRPIVGDCRALGRHHIAVDGNHAAGSCRINQHRRLATNCVHVRVDDALDECSSYRSVDGIAATSEHSRTGSGRKIMLRRKNRAAAHHERV